jgi:hypothetical protein
MDKLKKLSALAGLGIVGILTGQNAPNADSGFMLTTMGIFLLLCIPVFELDAYLNRKNKP